MAQQTETLSLAPDRNRDHWGTIPLFVREKQLRRDFLPVAHSTLWAWVSAGSFPAPAKLSSGVTAWKRSDLKSWAEGTWRVSGHLATEA